MSTKFPDRSLASKVKTVLASSRSLRTSGPMYALIILMLPCLVTAQQVITNSSGERIVIYPDGSWRVYEDADSVLLNTNLKKNEPIVIESVGAAGIDPNSNSPGDLEEVIRLANEFAAQTAREAHDANMFLSESIDKKFQVEAQLAQARENSNLIEPDKLPELEQQFKQQQEVVGLAKKHQKATAKFASSAEGILGLPVEKQGKKLTELMVKHDTYFANLSGIDIDQSSGKYSGTVRNSSSAAVATASTTSSGNSGKPIGVLGHADHEQTGYQRKPNPCTAVQHDMTRDNKTSVLVLKSEEILTYTDPDLRQYFRDNELLTCTAQVSQIDDNVYFTVKFSIASPNAQKNFGRLDKGSLLRLLLLDGSLINLYNLQEDTGKIDPYSGNTVFIGRYLLQKEAQRDLNKVELDKMRVVWATGYEDYDVHVIDFFTNQLSCLKNLQ